VVKEFGDIPGINCYPNQLNQVFMNLFLNADQAIKEKGMIRVKTFTEKKYITIKVSDTGEGIPAEHIDKVFNPGFTTRGAGVGTGLGLSISYNIIQKHHGSIRLESRVNQGTELTITLPFDKIEE